MKCHWRSFEVIWGKILGQIWNSGVCYYHQILPKYGHNFGRNLSTKFLFKYLTTLNYNFSSSISYRSVNLSIKEFTQIIFFFMKIVNTYLGWADWGSWNSCSVTCETGTQTRTRSCVGGSEDCPGSASESQSCSQPQCKFHLSRFQVYFIFRSPSIFEYSRGTFNDFLKRLRRNRSNCSYAFPSGLWGKDYSFNFYFAVFCGIFLRTAEFLIIIKRFGSTNRLQPIIETLFMLQMEINTTYLLFGSLRVTVISLFTLVFALMEIKIIVIIFYQQIYQFGLEVREHSIRARGTEWNTSKLQ